MNEDNKSWGIIVTNNHQHDEAVIEEKMLYKNMPSKVFLNPIVEGTSAISSDTLCTTALTHLQETQTGANMRYNDEQENRDLISGE